MDTDKLQQWMNIAKQYQNGDFWTQVFDKEDHALELDNRESKRLFPPADVYVTAEEVYVFIELAGVPKEDIQLTLSEQGLRIRGKVPPLLQDFETVQHERTYGEFDRTLHLPEPPENAPLQSKYVNGLLLVRYKRIKKAERRILIE
ncbi:Hsp20/alpha crystallin family protein [Halobacillus rhizosphaerae]|uniref:Hsp20/alpha crystallin family protein n=1 Tax=Halobacillus rhizosphaerae TaxID=3064889 RepID=UPI00398ABBB5